MLCSEASAAMSRRHDSDKMSESELNDLKAHLAVCPACRNFEKSLTGLSKNVSQAEAKSSHKLSDEAKLKLSAKLESQSKD